MVFEGARHPFLKMLQRVLKLLYRKHTITGADWVSSDQPAVFICNHLKSYAPIVLSLYLPLRFRPWVQANIVSPDLCRDFLEDDFVIKELGLRPPLSRLLASAIAPLCIRLMKSIGAIPVFKGQKRIRETFQISIDALNQRWNLVIFPENKTQAFSEFTHEFHTGFSNLAWLYFKETKRPLRFHPVFVDSEKRVISIGRPISLANIDPSQEKRKDFAGRLRDAVNRMAAGEH